MKPGAEEIARLIWREDEASKWLGMELEEVRAGYARIDALLDYLTENCCAGAATSGPGCACGPKKTGAKR